METQCYILFISALVIDLVSSVRIIGRKDVIPPGNVSEIRKVAYSRPLMTGDTLTPYEMLPISKKLLKKVENPGQGRGFVSSVKSANKLADKLFEVFFFTSHRIVTLKDFDISGLDALQALALSGETVTSLDKVKPPPKRMQLVNGQYVKINEEPMKCHYDLLLKKTFTPKKKQIKRRVSASELAKKLAKKRRLKMYLNRRDSKPRRRNDTVHNTAKGKKIFKNKPVSSIRKKINSKLKNKSIKDLGTSKNGDLTISIGLTTKKTTNKKSMRQRKSNNIQSYVATPLPTDSKNDLSSKKKVCRWRYECKNPANLDTCHLETQCSNGPLKDSGIVNRASDENSEKVKIFRKMLKISVIDEEVERIIERRVYHLRGMGSKSEIRRASNLSDYFNRLVMAVYKGSTTPNPVMRDLMQKIRRESREIESSKEREENKKVLNETTRKKGILYQPSMPVSTPYTHL